MAWTIEVSDYNYQKSYRQWQKGLKYDAKSYTSSVKIDKNIKVLSQKARQLGYH